MSYIPSYDLPLTTTAVKTGAHTAAPFELVRTDATGGGFTVTLPAASVAGQVVAVKLLTTSGSNTVSVARAGSDTINNGATSVTLTLADEAIELVSNGAGVWTVPAGRITLASLDARYPQRASNLSDLADAATARTNLGLGNVDNTADAAKPNLTACLLPTGHYIIPVGGRFNITMAASVEHAMPVAFGKAGSLDRIAIEVMTTPGTAGTVIRLGVRAPTATGLPGNLILDAGTVAGDAIAMVEATISAAIPGAGVYFLTATAQSTGGTLPVLRAVLGPVDNVHAPTLAGALGATVPSGYVTAATVTGALPASYTISNRAGVSPLVAVRAV